MEKITEKIRGISKSYNKTCLNRRKGFGIIGLLVMVSIVICIIFIVRNKIRASSLGTDENEASPPGINKNPVSPPGIDKNPVSPPGINSLESESVTINPPKLDEPKVALDRTDLGCSPMKKAFKLYHTDKGSTNLEPMTSKELLSGGDVEFYPELNGIRNGKAFVMDTCTNDANYQPNRDEDGQEYLCLPDISSNSNVTVEFSFSMGYVSHSCTVTLMEPVRCKWQKRNYSPPKYHLGPEC